jgi:hypothetical protein
MHLNNLGRQNGVADQIFIFQFKEKCGAFFRMLTCLLFQCWLIPPAFSIIFEGKK